MMTGIELVQFAESKLGIPYVYGMKGEVMTSQMYQKLKSLYGDLVWDSDKKKVGKVCCDCSGLISWATGIVLSSTQLYEKAVKREKISSIQDAPIGALVWKKGHVGIYAGNGQYIAEDGSPYGCRKNSLSKANFTHWLLMKYIDYSEEDEELVEKSEIIVDGKTLEINRILKDGNNFIKVRDIASILGYSVSSQGDIAVLTKVKYPTAMKK